LATPTLLRGAWEYILPVPVEHTRRWSGKVTGSHAEHGNHEICDSVILDCFGYASQRRTRKSNQLIVSPLWCWNASCPFPRGILAAGAAKPRVPTWSMGTMKLLLDCFTLADS